MTKKRKKHGWLYGIRKSPFGWKAIEYRIIGTAKTEEQAWKFIEKDSKDKVFE